MTLQEVNITQIDGKPAAPWASEQTMQALSNAIATLTGTQSSLLNATNKNTKAQTSNDTGTVNGAAKSLGESLQIGASAVDGYSKAIRTNSSTLTDFTKVLQSAGLTAAGVFTPLTMLADEFHSSWQTSAKLGQNFGGSILKMVKDVNNAGMSLQSFQETMEKGSQAIAAMGTDTFFNARKDMISTMREFGFFGMTLNETNREYGKFLEIQKASGGLLQNSTQRLNKSFKDLVQNASAVSELYGKDRNELLRKTMEELNQADAMMTSMDLLDKYGQKAVDTFNAVNTQISALPAEAQKGMRDMYDAAVNSDVTNLENNPMYKAFAVAGIDISTQLRQIGELTKSGNTAQAQAMFQQIQQQAADITKSPNWLSLRAQAKNNTDIADSVKALVAMSGQAKGLQTPGGGEPRKLDTAGQGKYTQETTLMQNLPSTMEAFTTTISGAFAGAVEKGMKHFSGSLETVNKALDGFVAQTQKEKLDTTVHIIGGDALAGLLDMIPTMDQSFKFIDDRIKGTGGAIGDLGTLISSLVGSTYKAIGVGGILGAATIASNVTIGTGGNAVTAPSSSSSAAAAATRPPRPGEPGWVNPGVNIPGAGPGVNIPNAGSEESLIVKLVTAAAAAAAGGIAGSYVIDGIKQVFSDPQILSGLGTAIGDGITKALSTLATTLGIEHHADGGSISGSSVVGEKGPELFTPNVSGYILANNKLDGLVDNIMAADKIGKQYQVDSNPAINYQAQSSFMSPTDNKDDPMQLRAQLLFKHSVRFQQEQFKIDRKWFELDDDTFEYNKEMDEKQYKATTGLTTILEEIHKYNIDEADNKTTTDKDKKPGDKKPDDKPKPDKDGYQDARTQAEAQAEKDQEKIAKIKAKNESLISSHNKFVNSYNQQTGRAPVGQPTSTAPTTRSPQQPQTPSPTESEARVAGVKPNNTASKSFDKFLEETHKDRDEAIKHAKANDAEGQKTKEEYKAWLTKLEEQTNINKNVALQVGKHQVGQPTSTTNQTQPRPDSFLTPQDIKEKKELASNIAELQKNVDYGKKWDAEHKDKPPIPLSQSDPNVEKMFTEHRMRMRNDINPKLQTMDLSKVNKEDTKAMDDSFKKIETIMNDVRKNIASGKDVSADTMKEANDESKKLQALVDKNSQAIAKNASNTQNLSNVTAASASATSGLTNTTQKVSDDTARSIITNNKDVKEAKKNYDDVMKNYSKETKRIGKAIQSGEISQEEGIKQQQEASNKTIDAHEKLTSAINQAKKSTQDNTTATNKSSTDTAKTLEGLEAKKKQILDNYKKTENDLLKKSDAARLKKDEIDKKIKSGEISEDDGNDQKDELDDQLAELGKQFMKVNTEAYNKIKEIDNKTSSVNSTDIESSSIYKAFAMSGMDISKQLKQLNEATIKGDTETAQKITQEINEQAKNIKPENLAALIAQSKNNPELLKDNPELLKAINNGPLANNMGTLTTALTNPNSSQFNKLTNKQALVNAKMSAKEQAKFDQQNNNKDDEKDEDEEDDLDTKENRDTGNKANSIDKSSGFFTAAQQNLIKNGILRPDDFDNGDDEDDSENKKGSPKNILTAGIDDINGSFSMFNDKFSDQINDLGKNFSALKQPKYDNGNTGNLMASMSDMQNPMIEKLDTMIKHTQDGNQLAEKSIGRQDALGGLFSQVDGKMGNLLNVASR